jgi:phosphoglycerate dehydrogenase-like enzyme
MPERFQVAITDFLDESSVEAPVLEGLASVQLLQGQSEADILDRVSEADAIIVYHVVPFLSDAVLSKALRCLGVVRGGVGFNNVDIEAAAKRGIVVCNVPDYGTEEVADHALMLILSVARRLIPQHNGILQGEWDYKKMEGAPRLRGKTLGLVGCGRIGKATAQRARAFGLDVVFYDPYEAPGLEKAMGIRRAETLEELLRQSHILSIHCYLDSGSQHLIDRSALALLPEGAIVVNTARGPVIEQDALIDALESGRLYGAGLDVVEREPLDDDRLRNHPRVVLTPHSAFYSAEGFLELRRKTAEEARRLLLGQPPRCPVNLAMIGERRRPSK